ncbi:hypothetical protein QE152_g6044 [Popillia japonica]|uniref:Uncharacterized protein n=1 Tax=Popillia japonica TaxID=7064 RepID=A0AAW1MID6_POPJA
MNAYYTQNDRVGESYLLETCNRIREDRYVLFSRCRSRFLGARTRPCRTNRTPPPVPLRVPIQSMLKRRQNWGPITTAVKKTKRCNDGAMHGQRHHRQEQRA